MATETKEEIIFEHNGITYGDKPMERIYAVRHGFGLVVRNDEVVKEFDEHGRLRGSHIGKPGYTIRCINHRADVPIEELQAALLIRDGDPKAPPGPRRYPSFAYEWRTAAELAKIIDRTDDTFVPEMYRLSVACGKIRADSGDRRYDMSEGLFIKMLKTELKGLGFEIES